MGCETNFLHLINLELAMTTACQSRAREPMWLAAKPYFARDVSTSTSWVKELLLKVPSVALPKGYRWRQHTTARHISTKNSKKKVRGNNADNKSEANETRNRSWVLLYA